MDKATSDRIKEILNKCVDGALTRTQSRLDYKPFHEALLSKKIVKASAFERSFSTSFGQGPIEEISLLVAHTNGFDGQRQKQTYFDIYKGAADEISRIIEGLRSGMHRPNWKMEVQRISSFTRGDTVPKRVISDLWLTKGNKEIFVSIKTVKPNLDQTEKAKKEMLELKAHNTSWEPYFALYYNPDGDNKKDYSWSVPNKLFDIQNDPCVLIGKEYWDFLGGEGTYGNLLEVFADVGKRTRDILLDD